jgi:hypothetical protein
MRDDLPCVIESPFVGGFVGRSTVDSGIAFCLGENDLVGLDVLGLQTHADESTGEPLHAGNAGQNA